MKARRERIKEMNKRHRNERKTYKNVLERANYQPVISQMRNEASTNFNIVRSQVLAQYPNLRTPTYEHYSRPVSQTIYGTNRTQQIVENYYNREVEVEVDPGFVQDLISEFYFILTDELKECPICAEVCYLKIQEHDERHSVCPTCSLKIKICPFCRIDI